MHLLESLTEKKLCLKKSCNRHICPNGHACYPYTESLLTLSYMSVCCMYANSVIIIVSDLLEINATLHLPVQQKLAIMQLWLIYSVSKVSL